MKYKKTILFNDYTIKTVDDRAISDCINAVHSNSKKFKRNTSFKSQFKTQLKYLGYKYWLAFISIITVVILASIYINIYLADYALVSLFLSTIGPLLVSFSLPLIARSYSYNMWEIEDSSLHNIPRLSFIRIIISLFLSLPVMLILLIIFSGRLGIFNVFFAIFSPFFLSSFICYFILGKIRGAQAIILCIGACICIVLINSSLVFLKPYAINIKNYLLIQNFNFIRIIAMSLLFIIYIYSIHFFVNNSNAAKIKNLA